MEPAKSRPMSANTASAGNCAVPCNAGSDALKNPATSPRDSRVAATPPRGPPSQPLKKMAG